MHTWQGQLSGETVKVILNLKIMNNSYNIDHTDECTTVHRVSHLVFPAQYGDGTSCTMSNDPNALIELQEFLQTEDIILIGWLHSHPEVG